MQDQIAAGVLRDDDTRIELSDKDKILCSRAKEALYAIQARETFAWTSDATVPVIGCQTALSCTSGKEDIALSILRMPLHIMALSFWPDKWNHRLCERCEVFARERHEASRLVVWNSLPHIFDFTKWPNLRLAEKQEVSEPSGDALFTDTNGNRQIQSTAGPSYIYKPGNVTLLYLIPSLHLSLMDSTGLITCPLVY